MSRYQVTLDPDITTDENGNGVYDDDFSRSGSGFTLTDTNMRFGPFDEPGSRQMILRVQDEYGNTSLLPLTLEVYAPIPTIQSMSATGWLQ